MGGEAGKGFNPMERCRRMTSSFGNSGNIAAYGTPELRGLFEEWLSRVEDDILAFMKESGLARPCPPVIP
jgi:hypothetical protein